MSTALYRRYRPETFADVIGQEHVTEPLIQALRSGRVNHAYLFSGPRGCGKTTSARILARCLNCDQGPTPEPCGQCESCQALARGGAGSVDVIEIDAASHGGVDDARDLRERAAFGPATSRYKVYVIDEAHMVTNQGFNALLKVVEEPPEHVKFIFATTEPDKVLATIRSRTHHYPFHLVPPQRLAGYLEQVCAAESITVEPGVMSFVTRAGGGSVRDSLSVLDQLIAGAGPEGLTYERTAALLGFTDLELLDAVVTAVAAGDAASVFTQVSKVVESGHDPRRFVEDLLERYRDLIVVTAVGDRTGGLLRGLPDDQVERLRQQAAGYTNADLTRCADIVSRGLAEMTGVMSTRTHLELIGARLLLPSASGEEGMATRLERIERRLASAGASATEAGSASAPSRSPAQAPVEPSPAPRPTADRARTVEPAATEAAATQPAAAPPSAEPATTEPAAAPPPAEPADEPVPSGSQASAEANDTQPAGGPAAALDTDALRRAWPEVLDRVKDFRKVSWSLVGQYCTVQSFDGRVLQLGIDNPGLVARFHEGGHDEVVQRAVKDTLQLDVRVEGVPPGSAPASRQPQPQAVAQEPAGPAPQVEPSPETTSPDPPEAQSAPQGAPTPEAQVAPESPAWQPPPEDDIAAWAPPPEPEPVEPPANSGARRSRGPAREQQSVAPEQDVADELGEGGSAAGAQDGDASSHERSQHTGGDEPSSDDEDLDTSGAVGQPVIESVLGGTVISIEDDRPQ